MTLSISDKIEANHFNWLAARERYAGLVNGTASGPDCGEADANDCQCAPLLARAIADVRMRISALGREEIALRIERDRLAS